MKIGKFNRVIKNFAPTRKMSQMEVRIILALNDEMWMGIADLIYYVVTGKKEVLKGLAHLTDRGYIKISRREVSFKRITRKYSITNKGRFIATEFKNRLI